jgi:hypothetical protein
VTDDQGGTAPIADYRHDLHSRQSSGIHEALEAQARPGACAQVVALGHGSDYRQIEFSGLRSGDANRCRASKLNGKHVELWGDLRRATQATKDRI